MLAWIAANLSSLLIGLALLLLAAAIVVYLVRSKKKGKSCCSGGCQGCSMNGCCHTKK
jgi:hypothetical protein